MSVSRSYQCMDVRLFDGELQRQLAVTVALTLSPQHGGYTQGVVVMRRAWWLYAGRGGCTQGMVVVRRAWWLYAGRGGCTQGVVVVHRAWWLYAGHGGYAQGMVAMRRALLKGRKCASLTVCAIRQE